MLWRAVLLDTAPAVFLAGAVFALLEQSLHYWGSAAYLEHTKAERIEGEGSAVPGELLSSLCF
jgi:hypothetical protein